ncbi:hypothetical protein [Rhodoferax sp. U11-2br]|uniref:hypothetical protein n=1 Tax=Rhodoferax sp. U11-2br TaxID=2838878 RepID=UPI001BECF7A5|nr:hypothetical protein [Rhodoferax sp. U11-2br]MBT3065297.1 hypothetical protein [Rhodoferax sp. U11-2br]
MYILDKYQLTLPGEPALTQRSETRQVAGEHDEMCWIKLDDNKEERTRMNPYFYSYRLS